MTRKENPARVIVVTGASRGLGREIALCFGRAGERVAVNYRSSIKKADSVVEEIQTSGGDAASYRADVSRSSEVDTMMNDILSRWGRIDVLVNNAAIAEDGLVLRMTEKSWNDVIACNLTGPFNCVRASGRIMSSQRDGHIISVASIVGLQGRQGQANYSSAKAGVIGLTKACARELGCFNIKVNAVLPGYLATDMGNAIDDHLRERIIGENALQRPADPREVAGFIFHLSNMSNVSGQVFNLDSRII